MNSHAIHKVKSVCRVSIGASISMNLGLSTWKSSGSQCGVFPNPILIGIYEGFITQTLNHSLVDDSTASAPLLHLEEG